jgi:hypothetical protein
VPIKVKILGNPSPKRQVVSGIVGGILLVGGISLYLPSMQTPEDAGTPTVDATESVQASLPVETTESIHVSPTMTDVPVTTDTPDTPQDEQNTIAITEVMASPCVDVTGASVNEFIELYNYGAESVNVDGWWMASNTRGDGDVPDKIVAWSARNPNSSLNQEAILDSTTIPPSGFAIILPPDYTVGDGIYVMPYQFPAETVVLSIESGERLGNETTGLLGKTNPLSVIVLYRGTELLIDEIISTYGTPVERTSPYEIRNNEDDLPFFVDDCHSVERINSSGPDVVANWRKSPVVSPGRGSYSQ